MKLLKSEESKSKDKQKNNKLSTSPFNSQKSLSQWRTIKSQYPNSKKNSQLMLKLALAMSRPKKDYSNMVPTN